MIEKIVSDSVLEEAYAWVCKARRHYSANSDIWWLMDNWPAVKHTMICEVLQGKYQFAPQQGYSCSMYGLKYIWCARDAVLIKAVSLVLGRELYFLPSCTHVKGNGGIHHAVNHLYRNIGVYDFYFRSDIAGYYASMQHSILLREIRFLITDDSVVSLIEQTIRRTELYAGNIHQVMRGIPLGSSLSPLLAAIMLNGMDRLMHKNKIFYIRFMDDWVILSKTRNHLKKAIRIMYRFLNNCDLVCSYAKTSMGRSTKGFNFLGFAIKPQQKLQAATVTIARYLNRLKELIVKPSCRDWQVQRIRIYHKGWCCWYKGIIQSKSLPAVIQITNNLTKYKENLLVILNSFIPINIDLTSIV